MNLKSVLLFSAIFVAQSGFASGKGINYMTGFGMEQLNCAGSDRAQIAKDMKELHRLNVGWVRIETSSTAIASLSSPPNCPRPASEFDHLLNIVSGIREIGASPLLNILSWHYSPDMVLSYTDWLNRLLSALPSEVQTFEIGNEPNLSSQSEAFPGADPDVWPYGWTAQPKDLDASDPLGVCPADPARLADLQAAAKSFVEWLKLSSSIIRARRPRATIIIGALSSWQPDCWIQQLGALGADSYADALGYHPYPRGPSTAVDAAQTLVDAKALESKWRKALPIWVTEFGFSTNPNDQAGQVANEAEKSAELVSEFLKLRAQLSSPIFVYAAREWMTTSGDWTSNGSMGGYGLFEWREGQLLEEPAFSAFSGL